MPFPKTMGAMKDAGYQFIEHATCRGSHCRRMIEWWLSPKGKRMPFDLMPNASDQVTAHFATCPDVQSFRK
jgi:hypothetical protein